ncbi:hypothetical protein HPP92_003396 [Vanilla planifolia]|uniref:Uncharacterized protein n=1 Tax=Vanilla planifolia TaxID=51239 RepID=A0A835S1P7_VANPL|nr:hypothetical protein HPP92_003396 [Vanilla planifolia]
MVVLKQYDHSNCKIGGTALKAFLVLSSGVIYGYYYAHILKVDEEEFEDTGITSGRAICIILRFPACLDTSIQLGTLLRVSLFVHGLATAALLLNWALRKVNRLLFGSSTAVKWGQ